MMHNKTNNELKTIKMGFRHSNGIQMQEKYVWTWPTQPNPLKIHMYMVNMFRLFISYGSLAFLVILLKLQFTKMSSSSRVEVCYYIFCQGHVVKMGMFKARFFLSV